MRCLSCLGLSKKSPRDVLLIKQNGKIIKSKQGTLVKHILASYPNHVVLQCWSKSLNPAVPVTVLPDSSQLGWGDDNSIYLLVAKDQGLSDPETLMRSILSRITSAGNSNGDRSHDQNSGDKDGNGKTQLSNACFEYRKSLWQPALHTIPETPSPQNL